MIWKESFQVTYTRIQENANVFSKYGGANGIHTIPHEYWPERRLLPVSPDTACLPHLKPFETMDMFYANLF